MSKKKQRKTELHSPTAEKKKEAARITDPSGLNSMINWLVVLLALLPFLISEKALDPALTSRYIFLSVFCGFFFLAFIVWKKNYTPISSLPPMIRMVFYTGLVFAAWSILSMSGSINYREGYLDTFRHLLNLVVLYLIIATIIREQNKWILLAKTITVVALLQSLVGILQFYEIAFNKLPGANSKPFGLMANRNFFGSAQVFVAPFVLYAFSRTKQTWRLISGLSLAGIIISVFISQTRSAWLALILLGIITILLITIYLPSERKKWWLGAGIALLVTAALTAFLLVSDTNGELKSSVKARAASLTGNLELEKNAAENITERIVIWKKTVRMIKDHPVMGVGPGNWKIIFPSYGLAGLQFAEGIISPDRPHNVYLQIAGETGIPGAILYFAVWVMIAICGFRTIRRTDSSEIKLIVILMLGGLAAVATDAFFSFPIDRIEHSLYCMLMGGTVLGLYAQQSLKEKSNLQRPGPLFLIVTGLIILLNIILAVKNRNFEIAWKIADQYNTENRYQETLEEVKKGKNALAVMDVSGVPLELFAAHAYKELKDYPSAFKEIKKARSYHPYMARIYSEWGTIYTGMQKFDSAIYYYKKALELTPRYEVPIMNLAVNYFASGQDSLCIAELNKVNIEKNTYLKNMQQEAQRRLDSRINYSLQIK